MMRLPNFVPLVVILKIQIAAAIMGCDFCLDILCLVRTRCPTDAENIFKLTDVDFDYNNDVMYTIGNTLRAVYFDKGGIEEIPTETGNQSLVSLAVDRRTSDVYYSTSSTIYMYAPIRNVTTVIYSNLNRQKFVSVWVNRGTVFFTIRSAGLYYFLPETPDIRNVTDLNGVFIEDVAFDSSGVAYISSKQKVYRIKEKETMRAAEFVTGHYLIAADKTGNVHMTTNRRLYLVDQKTDKLRLVGAFGHYVYQFLFDNLNYVIAEDQGKFCAHYKPVPDRCIYDVSADIPEIRKVLSIDY